LLMGQAGKVRGNPYWYRCSDIHIGLSPGLGRLARGIRRSG
jgi:hypothetical protein